ncbi:hypothetical protein TNCV_864481 [Trichonephila clavipes]|nr:hypothetical protein TNCV_864481 [Trichonephila clavipes]
MSSHSSKTIATEDPPCRKADICEICEAQAPPVGVLRKSHLWHLTVVQNYEVRLINRCVHLATRKTSPKECVLPKLFQQQSILVETRLKEEEKAMSIVSHRLEEGAKRNSFFLCRERNPERTANYTQRTASSDRHRNFEPWSCDEYDICVGAL